MPDRVLKQLKRYIAPHINTGGNPVGPYFVQHRIPLQSEARGALQIRSIKMPVCGPLVVANCDLRAQPDFFAEGVSGLCDRAAR